MPAVRRARQPEGHALHKAVLRRFGHLQRAALELVGEGHLRSLACLYRDALRLLRLIERCGILRHGVHTWHEIIQLQLTVFVRRYVLAEIVPCDCKGNSGDLAVLGGLFELQVSIRHGEQQIALHRVIHRFRIRHQILKSAANAEPAVRPCDYAASRRIFLFCRQRDRRGWRVLRCQKELVSLHLTVDAVRRKRVVFEHTIFVR